MIFVGTAVGNERSYLNEIPIVFSQSILYLDMLPVSRNVVALAKAPNVKYGHIFTFTLMILIIFLQIQTQTLKNNR